MTALRLSTVTWVGSGQVRMDVGFSLCAAPTSYRSPSISYVIRNLGPQVLGPDSARLVRGDKAEGRGVEAEVTQSEVKLIVIEWRVQDISGIDIRTAGTYM